MKNRVFAHNGMRTWVREHNNDDLIGKGPFKDLLGVKTERAARQKVKDIVALSAQLIMHDMIEHCDVFCFPVNESGFIRICDMTKTYDVAKYRFHIKYDGRTYGGMISLNKIILRMNKSRFYRFIPTQEHLKRIRTLRSQGHRWP